MSTEVSGCTELNYTLLMYQDCWLSWTFWHDVATNLLFYTKLDRFKENVQKMSLIFQSLVQMVLRNNRIFGIPADKTASRKQGKNCCWKSHQMMNSLNHISNTNLLWIKLSL